MKKILLSVIVFVPIVFGLSLISDRFAQNRANSSETTFDKPTACTQCGAIMWMGFSKHSCSE